MVSTSLFARVIQCNLRELKRNFDEREVHEEYSIRHRTLGADIQILRKIITQNPIDESLKELLSLIFIVYQELLTAGPWNLSDNYSKDLNEDFMKVNNVSIDKILCDNSPYDTQQVFEYCMEYLHSKLTAEKFKKYPSLIKVYYAIICGLHEYNVKPNPMRTLPAALVLLDDYVEENKVLGLTCCKCILNCLKFEDFNNGNYYEAVYVSLKKIVTEKNVDAIKLVFECFLKLIIILPANNRIACKRQKLSELLTLTIDEILMETNIFRKTALFHFLKEIIELHKADCMRMNKKFMSIIIENLILSVNNDFKLLILDTIEVWIKYCWCVWRYKDNKKLINALLKTVYTSISEETDREIHEVIITRIQELIICLTRLSSPKEQEEINSYLEKFTTESNLVNAIEEMGLLKFDPLDK